MLCGKLKRFKIKNYIWYKNFYYNKGRAYWNCWESVQWNDIQPKYVILGPSHEILSLNVIRKITFSKYVEWMLVLNFRQPEIAFRSCLGLAVRSLIQFICWAGYHIYVRTHIYFFYWFKIVFRSKLCNNCVKLAFKVCIYEELKKKKSIN